MSDGSIRQHIDDLVKEEHTLRQRLSEGTISAEEEHARLREVEVELDQYWDLLRQRQAKEEFGENPDTAQVRAPGVVEGYLG